MTSPSGWPDPARVVPPPEFAKVDGLHLIKGFNFDSYDIAQWRAVKQIWILSGVESLTPEQVHRYGWRYHAAFRPDAAQQIASRDTELATLRAEVEKCKDVIKGYMRLCDPSVDAYEALGHDFYKETRYLRPGKSVSDAVWYKGLDEERGVAWRIWVKKQWAAVENAARAALNPPAEGGK